MLERLDSGFPSILSKENRLSFHFSTIMPKRFFLSLLIFRLDLPI